MLKKKSPKTFFFSVWQDRYARLTREGLSYYKRKEEAEVKGLIPIDIIRNIQYPVENAKDKKLRFDILLEVNVSKRVFAFQTATEEEAKVR